VFIHPGGDPTKKTKKSKKAQVVVKDLELSKVKGGAEEEDPKGGIIDGKKGSFLPAVRGTGPVLPAVKGTGPMLPTGVKLGEGFRKN
jgi:hypothetical protein